MAPLTESAQALADDERALLGDLLAVIEEHSLEGSRRIDAEATERAFAFACERHADQRRRTGEDFITHPVEVAKICAGLRLDTETLCAALLHDTVEDTSASLDQVEELFGDSVAQLVDGVTKLTEITFQSRDERQAENYRKMMVAMATDLRVILIKLADRLHNMRTVSRAAEAEADREGPRDARDLRAARPPAGDPRDQVGARGPLVPAPAPAQVRGDQEARLPAARRARALRRRRRPVPEARAEEGRHRGRDLGARQALLLDLLEDDQEGAGVQRDLRPHRDAGAGGLGQGLLRGDRDHPFDLEAAARAVQGPDRDPEDEPLPGAPHDGDRPRGTAARDPDPHPGDARDRRVRDRRPRHLQGGRAPEGRSREGEDDLAAAAARGRGRTGPDRVPRVAEGGPVRGRGLRVHAEGRGQEPLRRLDAARLRLRRPHRRRPPLRGREGERQDRPAALPAQVRRHRRDPDREAGAGPLARLAGAGADQPRAQQDPRLPEAREPRGRRAQRARAAPGRASASAACRRSGSRPRRCSPT